MLARFGFLAVVMFWLTMNVLLWRAEYGIGQAGGSPVPVDTVVRRILTAPDDSSLEIRRNGERIGYCHWVAGAVEELTLETPEEMEGLPEGMVVRPSGFGIRMDGGILTGDASDRVRFNLSMELTAEREWREFTLRLGARPAEWEIKASVERQTVELRWGGEEGALVRQFGFDELRDPRRLVEEMGGPLALAFFPRLAPLATDEMWGLGLEWEARMDWLPIGGSRVQAYRLTARLVDRHRVVIWVSRVGEILRVDLPEGFSVVNDVLVNF
jgi:hypothetical protein